MRKKESLDYKMKDKFVLLLGGGAMSGVFGGGIVTALQEMDIYDRIEAVYGGSAGAMNGAYFLARQTRLGATIYYEEMANGFLFPWNIPAGIFHRFWSRFFHSIPPERQINAVDLDYIFDVIKNKKALDVRRVKEQDIPFYVRVLNVETGETESIDVRTVDDVIGLLKASSSVVPYYFPHEKINGCTYVDGNTRNPVGLSEILRRHPERKIVAVINLDTKRKPHFHLKNSLEGLVTRLMFDIPFTFFTERERVITEELELARTAERVLLVHQPDGQHLKPFVTDPEKLRAFYLLGIQEASKVMEFLEI